MSNLIGFGLIVKLPPPSPVGGGHMTSPFIPMSFDHYCQLFLSLLKFLITFLTCPGAHHKEASVQVASFIALHSEVFAAVLKEPLHASMDIYYVHAAISAILFGVECMVYSNLLTVANTACII